MLLREWLQHEQTGRAQAQAVARATYEAMVGCLGCRACATRCPTHVDVPALRSRFLDAYHRTNRRPARDHLLAWSEHLLPLAARWHWLLNPMLDSRPAKRVCAWLRVTAMPRIPAPARAFDVLAPATVDELLAVCRRHERPVVIVPDAFTLYLDPPVFVAALRVIRAVGATPVVMPYRPSGKALHVHGFLERFRRIAEGNAEHFERVRRSGIPLVTIDPAITDALGSDYREIASGEEATAPLAAWLVSQKLPRARKPDGRGYRLALHCTERAIRPESAAQWIRIFAATGLELEVVDVGCCGMAGTYGHLKEHRAHSRSLFDSSWRPVVTACDSRPLLATGYSCRAQSERLIGDRLQHPIEILAGYCSIA